MALTEEQVNIRFKSRRRIAGWSFVLMSATLIVLIAGSVISDTFAARAANIQWLIGTAAGLWSTLTLGYYAATSYEQGKVQ